MHRSLVNIYSILPEDWFEMIGDPSCDEEEHAPLNYENVCTILYVTNSFYGSEKVDLLVDKEKEIFYIRSAIRQPIGDYAWSTVWTWYKSYKTKYEEIKNIIGKAMGETKDND